MEIHNLVWRFVWKGSLVKKESNVLLPPTQIEVEHKLAIVMNGKFCVLRWKRGSRIVAWSIRNSWGRWVKTRSTQAQRGQARVSRLACASGSLYISLASKVVLLPPCRRQGGEEYSCSFLTPALYGDEWSASRLGRALPRERTSGTQCTGGWVGPRAGLDTEVRGKMTYVFFDPSDTHNNFFGTTMYF
jgi:hypothetical protein